MQSVNNRLYDATRLQSRGSHRMGWFVVAAASALLLLVDVLTVDSGRIQSRDRATALAAHHAFGTGMFQVFDGISLIGGPVVRTIAAASIALTLIALRRWRTSVLLVVAVAAGGMADEIVTQLVARPRPHLFRHALHADGYSFPSGRTTGTFVFLAVVTYCVWQLTHKPTITVP